MQQNIRIRMDALKLGLEEIEAAYQETLKDSQLELGLVNETYPIDETHNALFRQAEDITKKRKEVLYYRIFCFSQVVFSLKDYLKKSHPVHTGKIESFFSDPREGGITIKQMSNDMKHNPKLDLKYGLVIKSSKSEIINKTQITTTYANFNWGYQRIDSIDHCKYIYKEIRHFLQEDLSYNLI
jgi:hypothetical protein